MNNKRRSIKQKRRYQYAQWLAEFAWVYRVTRKQFYQSIKLRRMSTIHMPDTEARQARFDALEKELLEGPPSVKECRIQQRRTWSITGKSVLCSRARTLKRFPPVPVERSEGETEMRSPLFRAIGEVELTPSTFNAIQAGLVPPFETRQMLFVSEHTVDSSPIELTEEKDQDKTKKHFGVLDALLKKKE